MHACIKQATQLLACLPPLNWQGASQASLRRQGEHPERRAGVGHDYWQFRPYTNDDSRHRIDWKRSARDDTLYVRQQEQEVPRTLHVFLDSHASMHYRGKGAHASKYDVALTLALTFGAWASSYHEAVALQGLSAKRFDSGYSLPRLLEALTTTPYDFTTASPPLSPLPLGSHSLLLTDGFHKEGMIEALLKCGRGDGRQTFIVLLHDPDEVSFPFQGRREFTDATTEHTVGKAQALQARYRDEFTRWRNDLLQRVAYLQGRAWPIITDDDLTRIAPRIAKGFFSHG